MMSKARIIAYFAALPAGALKLKHDPQGDDTMAPAAGAAAEGGAPAGPQCDPDDECCMCVQPHIEAMHKADKKYMEAMEAAHQPVMDLHMHLDELQHKMDDPQMMDPQMMEMTHKEIEETKMKLMEAEADMFMKEDDARKAHMKEMDQIMEEGEAECKPKCEGHEEEEKQAETDGCQGDAACKTAVDTHHEPCDDPMKPFRVEGKCEPWFKTPEGKEELKWRQEECDKYDGAWMPDEVDGGKCEYPPAEPVAPAAGAGADGQEPPMPPAGAQGPPAGEQGPPAGADGQGAPKTDAPVTV